MFGLHLSSCTYVRDVRGWVAQQLVDTIEHTAFIWFLSSSVWGLIFWRGQSRNWGIYHKCLC